MFQNMDLHIYFLDKLDLWDNLYLKHIPVCNQNMDLLGNPGGSCIHH